MRKAIIIRGEGGTGKSTLARKIVKEKGWSLIPMDYICQEIMNVARVKTFSIWKKEEWKKIDKILNLKLLTELLLRRQLAISRRVDGAVIEGYISKKEAEEIKKTCLAEGYEVEKTITLRKVWRK